MKARLLLVLFVVLTSGAVYAQDRFQVFGGYSLIGYSVYPRYSGPATLFDFNGWNASFTAKVAPHVALEGDFSGGVTGYFQTTPKTFAYIGGPRGFGNVGRATLSGHVLFGGMTFSAPGRWSCQHGFRHGRGRRWRLLGHWSPRSSVDPGGLSPQQQLGDRN